MLFMGVASIKQYKMLSFIFQTFTILFWKVICVACYPISRVCTGSYIHMKIYFSAFQICYIAFISHEFIMQRDNETECHLIRFDFDGIALCVHLRWKLASSHKLIQYGDLICFDLTLKQNNIWELRTYLKRLWIFYSHENNISWYHWSHVAKVSVHQTSRHSYLRWHRTDRTRWRHDMEMLFCITDICVVIHYSPVESLKKGQYLDLMFFLY